LVAEVRFLLRAAKLNGSNISKLDDSLGLGGLQGKDIGVLIVVNSHVNRVEVLANEAGEVSVV